MFALGDDTTETAKEVLREKISRYLARAETLKGQIKPEILSVQQIHIGHNDVWLTIHISTLVVHKFLSTLFATCGCFSSGAGRMLYTECCIYFQTGFGYEKIFKRCVDNNLTEINVRDAYIILPYQVCLKKRMVK